MMIQSTWFLPFRVLLGSKFFNLLEKHCIFKGKLSGENPWKATTLEWQGATTPPGHGNFGDELPVVYRWAYAYSVPGVEADFVPQNLAPDKVKKSS